MVVKRGVSPFTSSAFNSSVAGGLPCSNVVRCHGKSDFFHWCLNPISGNSKHILSSFSSSFFVTNKYVLSDNAVAIAGYKNFENGNQMLVSRSNYTKIGCRVHAHVLCYRLQNALQRGWLYLEHLLKMDM